MKNKKLLFLFLLGGLTACDKHHYPIPGMNATPTPAPSVASKSVIFAGQSNAGGVYNFSANIVINGINTSDQSPMIRLGCAVGGSSIAQWQPGTPNYMQCIQYVKNFKLDPAAIVWWQGESDAENMSAFTWAKDFTNFANNFRKDIGKPNLPIAYARLGDQTNPSMVNISEMKHQADKVFIQNGIEVDMAGITVGPDGTHYTYDGYQIAGQRFGLALASLMK